MRLTFETSATPDAGDLAFLNQELTKFNDLDVGPANHEPLSVFVRDADNIIVSGISGYTAWGWLYIQWLWVNTEMRGQKLAGRMIETAEQEAQQRGCHSAFIDTFNPVAAKTYLASGYEPFGALKNFPAGRQRIFLQKKLRILK